MVRETVVHNSSGNKSHIKFDFGEKSVILTTSDREEAACEGDFLIIFTDRDLPVGSASQKKSPRIIYANRHVVQDSNGKVEETVLWRGRQISSILLDMLGIRAHRKTMEDFHTAVEKFVRE